MPLARPKPPIRRTGAPLTGSINGVNTVFTVTPPEEFDPATFALFYNGQRLHAADDFTLSESGGLNSGWDTITLLFAPKNGDRLLADYVLTTTPF